MKKAYIFDFDGTLVDSMPTWSAKMLYVLKKSNTSYPNDIIKTITPLGDIGAANYFQESLGCSWSKERMLATMDEYALPKYRDEILLKEGVREYLQRLKKQGISLHVLTASPHKMVDPCLRRCGVYDWFENVWSCDDFALSKSNVEIYRQAAARIGVSLSECAFFDDNIYALKTAKQAGMFAVGVYDASGEEFILEMKEFADVYLYKLNEAKEF